MDKLPETSDYALGLHTEWERHLHRALYGLSAGGKDADYAERKQIVDSYVQAHPNTANNIVCCEVCQEDIANAILGGKDPFEIPDGVRELLESQYPNYVFAKPKRK